MGAAVLVHTGWSRRWGSDEFFIGSPYLTPGPSGRWWRPMSRWSASTRWTSMPSRTGAGRRTTSCSQRGMALLEHLTNLDAVPGTGARLTALPAPVRGMGTFPVRAVAVR